RPGLIRSFLRAFYNLNWRGAPELELVTLGGQHDESAVLQVFVEQELWDFSEIPLVSPSVGLRQVFVAHPQVAHRHREHYVDFFARAGSLVGLEARQVESFRAELHERAGMQLGATLGHLAAGLPLFEVHFEGDHRVRVVEAGHVAKG
ncbi:MAG TPA: hypothetical protein VK447_06660, partial [Myxococcaceae bacterium]|nr:hypothetical protein [Myxococcaceae bacterium]